MREYELEIISKHGITHRYHCDAETAKDAISQTFWGIGGCHWFQARSDETPCVRVKWETEGEGGNRAYVKRYTCNRLRLLASMRWYTAEDLNNMLLGRDVVFIVSDDLSGADMSYHRDLSTVKIIDPHYESVRWEWLRYFGDEEDEKQFMEQFRLESWEECR